jgi:subtilisin-like proprotein convertase family protein
VELGERQFGPWRLKISELEPGSQDLADTLAFEAWRREHPEQARELFAPGQPRRAWPLPEVATPKGTSLEALFRKHGGWTITLRDPAGQEHDGSLEPWRTADPERTYLRTSFERHFERA